MRQEEMPKDRQIVYGCPYDTADFKSAVAILDHLKEKHPLLPVRAVRIARGQSNVR